MYDYGSILFLLPIIILSFIVQGKLNSTYSKYAKIQNSKNMTGAQMAMQILSCSGVSGVSVEAISGHLTDHFDPRKNVIRLSADVYNGTSVSAIGIAAHETGHALQYSTGYFPIKLRSAIVGVTNFSSRILYLVIILSFISGFAFLCDIAVACFFVIFFFQLVTLPVEFNASKRAIQNIKSLSFSDNEVRGVKSVLSCAAMTYIVAMLMSLAQMLRYISRTRNRR